MPSKNLLGIFDSGVGGFSVYKEIRKITDVDILYYGDCANAPYGNRSKDEIIVYIRTILLHLKAKGVTHFVSACNSMSVNTTDALLKDVGIERERYVDMIDAVTKIPYSQMDVVLIVGTQATINSDVYQSILRDKNISHDVFVPTTLAGEIEKGDEEEIVKSIKEILLYAKNVGSTNILYACTHYPLVSPLFEQEAKEVSWSGSFNNPARYVQDTILEWNVSGSSCTEFETSLETKVFEEYRKKV